jgi:hypothetical protein
VQKGAGKANGKKKSPEGKLDYLFRPHLLKYTIRLSNAQGQGQVNRGGEGENQGTKWVAKLSVSALQPLG